MYIVGVPLTPFTAPLITLPKLDKIPSYLMWNPKYLVPIQNQGDCGACWAFAVTDVLADRAMIQTGALFDKNLSVEQLLACYNRAGCEGGSPEECMQWLSDTQTELKLSQVFPYKSNQGGIVGTVCPKELPGPGVKVDKGSVRSLVEFIAEDKFSKKTLASNILAMKTELITGGPFYCAMTVYDDLFSFTGTKVYSREKGSSPVGGHAIEIIGYSDINQDPRKGFTKAHWICRNSWSDGWPTHSSIPGYFMVEMGVNMCGIESRCGIAEPDILATLSEKDALPLDQLRFSSFEEYSSSV